MHYCISDIHGCFGSFLKMLETIAFSDDDYLYILGDAIDRGDENVELLKYIIDHPNICLLKGNHEDMAVKCLKNYNHDDSATKLWRYNGGDMTLRQFLKLDGKTKRELINYLDKLLMFKEIRVNDKEYILFHAGFDTYRYLNVRDCPQGDFLWFRGPFLQRPYLDKISVSGHLPTQLMVPYLQKALLMHDFDHDYYNEELIKKAIRQGSNNEVITFPYHFFIDCACVFGRRLACIRLEDEKIFYI